MKTTTALASALLIALFPASTFAAEQSPADRAGDKAKITRTVKIEMTEYSFSQQQMEFKAGETVKFIVSNKGKPKHEMTIGTPQEQEAHRKAMQQMSDSTHTGHSGNSGHSGHGGHGDHGSKGHHGMDHDMPSGAIHVDPGQTKEFVWQFTTAATLQFACNYPGHADLGMEGKIAVK